MDTKKRGLVALRSFMAYEDIQKLANGKQNNHIYFRIIPRFVRGGDFLAF